jgi:hypothetical protein
MSETNFYLDFSKFIEEAAAEVKKSVRHIESVGVELEGGVPRTAVERVRTKLYKLELDHRFEWGFDGSVHVPKPFFVEGEWDDDAELRFWVETYRIEILFDFVETLWKYGFRQNRTCGNHIHLKFYNNLTTLSLIFNEKFVKEFEKKYMIYARARGQKYVDRIENSYCRFYEFHHFPAALHHYQRSRYHAVNFVSVDEQETLEVRILPYAESAEEYIENVVWLLKTVDKLVEKMKKIKKIAIVRIGMLERGRPKEEIIEEEFEV